MTDQNSIATVVANVASRRQRDKELFEANKRLSLNVLELRRTVDAQRQHLDQLHAQIADQEAMNDSLARQLDHVKQNVTNAVNILEGRKPAT